MRTNEQIFIWFLVMLVGASTLSAQNKKEYNRSCQQDHYIKRL